MDFTHQIILLFHPVINPSKDSLKERTYQKAPVSHPGLKNDIRLALKRKNPRKHAGFSTLRCPEQDSNLHIRTDTSP